MHSTRKLDDGYLGSGKVLRRSLYKHGRDNHKIEILEFFESREDLAKGEEVLINKDVLNDPLCMNLQPGGGGGLCNINHKLKFILAGQMNLEKTKELRLEKLRLLSNDENWLKRKSEKLSKSLKGKQIWLGKKHSNETKLKMSNSHSEKHNGTLNSQFGTMWITNELENKKIKKDSLIPEGWKKGRKIMKAHRKVSEQ